MTYEEVGVTIDVADVEFVHGVHELLVGRVRPSNGVEIGRTSIGPRASGDNTNARPTVVPAG
ncbi:hypothetical protein [Nocardia bovistercoris]|uniref:Uncharacterized protein n=1 Tax=Nocardia bovistercoris TaxID=2785916 RepID=A0A931I8W8_9NOCA|nr:hypothetical protein [Nocardia bovistercoris]MBH0776471.1 hypothetical protein [Nocardia bovistercoris]